nr:hypothetical protein [uncultured Porphyromonas sp.]
MNNSKLMQELSTFFCKVVKCKDPERRIVITEGDQGATLKELRLRSTSCGLEKLPSKNLCQGLWRDRHNHDFDCDGIVLLADKDKGEPTLLLVELKSKLTSKSLPKAVEQVVISLLKMHTLFSLCSSYNGILSPVEVLICCSDNSNLMSQMKALSMRCDGHLSSELKLYRSLLGREGEKTKFLLRDVLKVIGWANGWSMPASLLNLELVIQILCSEQKDAIEHSL